ncbi:MAG: hypothetical protein A3F10_00240 [Coxiella sp. RIFCSPHIGHO2_12_FULL_42_15]|nr:MAG: hypothetical protein A3F10_00240 [Coxiella sp. RIFCSPHIGHO2_12_FULL_42_15]
MTDVALMRRRSIMRCFDRAADSYDSYAELQFQVGLQLVRAIQKQATGFLMSADVGCGTGLLTNQLVEHLSIARIFPIDISTKMVMRCQQNLLRHRKNCLVGDFNFLPFFSNSMELIFSNMTLQWSFDLVATLQELLRCLKVGGFLAFTLFVEGTLENVRELLNINSFYSTQFLNALLRQLPVEERLFETATHEKHFQDLWSLIAFFKKTGANYTAEKKSFSTMREYHQKIILSKGSHPINASFNVATCILRKIER